MKVDMNNYFIEDWMAQMKQTVKLTYPTLTDKQINDYLVKILEDNIKVPIATLDNNYLRKTKRVDALSLIQWIKDNEFIIAGNGTIFKNQNQEYNPTIHMLIGLKEQRTKLKNERNSLDPNSYEYKIKDIGQNTKKRAMNSDYGGAGSPITFFYNLYCAVSTTATGQSLISTAMCTFENFFSDNVKFIDYDDFAVYVNNIVNEEYTIDDSFLDDKSIEDVFYRLRKKFIYFRQNYEYPIMHILEGLNQQDLNKLYYKNNLYEFCRLPKIKKMLFNLTSKTNDFLDPNDIPDNIHKDLEIFWNYLNNFVVYNYFAFNRIGRLNCDPRDTVCTIDTDSNMLTLSPWVDFMLEEIVRDDAEILNKGSKNLVYIFINTICFIATKLITSHLMKFADRSGILPEYKHFLNMKNEFLFFKMLLFETKKRYMSKILLREGHVYEKLDNKGVDHLKSTCNDFTRDFITNLIASEILEKENDDIVIKNIINGVDDLANKVRDSLEKGEKTFLSPMKVKQEGAYKKPFQEQSFRGAYAWNVIYPDQTIEFPDQIDVVLLNIPTLETIEDIKDKYPVEYKNIKEKIFESRIEEVKKKGLMVLALPKKIKEIPEWCRPYIDYDSIVNANTSKMNSALESLGIQTIKTNSTTTHYSNIISF